VKRLLVLIAVLVGLAAFNAPVAEANPTCTITAQFDSTQSTDDGTNWLVLLTNKMTASCTSAWYVTFTAQCFDGGVWAQCITNQLCNYPSCTAGWTPGSTHTYNETTGSPPGFTGYWDNGDGLTSSRPTCHYKWRIRESFRRKSDAFLITTAFSPDSTVTC
jgi:hypothetical protein